MAVLNDLNISKEALSSIFMDSADPILVEDLNGIVIELNTAAKDSYGWSRDELLGQPIKTIVPPKYHEQADLLLAQCKKGIIVKNIEGKRWQKDGTIIPVLLTLSLLKDETNKPIGISTIAKDITQLKIYEEKTRLLSKVFMDSTDPIIIEDTNGNVVELNHETELVYAWSRKELKGKPIKTIVPLQCHKQADRLLKQCLAGEKVKNIEGQRCTKSGKLIPVLLTLSALKDEDKNTIAVATIAKDITQLKHAETLIKLTQVATIESMGTLAEYRDPETGGHIKRTKEYVKLLAGALREHSTFHDYFDQKTIESLYKSAPLHDIGKVGVKDSILLKPGKLTDEEFDEMKKHTIYGQNTISSLEKVLGPGSFLHLAGEIAAYHHERWDGTGYPYHLKGNEIPVSARLMAIADVYDALISRRVYKPPFSHDKAVEIMRNGQGSHFDPDMLDVFLVLENEFREIALKFADCDEEREALKKR